MYETYRRSDANDQPRPETVGHQWCVAGPTGVCLWKLEFPDTEEGRATASAIAGHLNTAFEAGKENVRTAMRDALGVS